MAAPPEKLKAAAEIRMAVYDALPAAVRDRVMSSPFGIDVLFLSLCLRDMNLSDGAILSLVEKSYADDKDLKRQLEGLPPHPVEYHNERGPDGRAKKAPLKSRHRRR